MRTVVLMAATLASLVAGATGAKAGVIPEGSAADNYHYTILANPTSGDEFGFRSAMQQYAQGRSDKLFTALRELLGGDTPHLSFTQGIAPAPGLTEVHLSATPGANQINVDPYAVEGLVDDGSPIHSGAVNQMPHEMAHLRQVTKSVPDREGGAQAFADYVASTAAARARIPYTPGNFDGSYADYVKQAQARGLAWLLAGQFGKPGSPQYPKTLSRSPMSIFPTALGRTTMPAAKPKVAVKPPLTDAQIAQQQVTAAFDPVVKSITDAMNARGVAQGNAITGYTKTLADLMGQYGPTAQGAYTGAAAGQSAIDAALAAGRAGQGAQASSDLAAKLAAIHADPATAARISGGYSGDLAGAAQAAAGRGAANLGMLLAQGAHAGDYGAKLPGIAAGMGLNANERAQGQITSDLQSSLQGLEAKRPDAYQTALSGIQTNRAKSQQLAFEDRVAAKTLGLKSASTKATIANNQAKTKQAAVVASDKSSLAWANLTEKQRHDQADEAAAQKRADTAAQRAAAAAVAKKNPSLTPGERATIAKNAAKDAEDLYHGVTKTNSSGQQIVESYTQTYKDAIKTLMNRYPSLGRTAVIRLANTWYAPGQFGRPAAPNPSITTGPTLAQAGR